MAERYIPLFLDFNETTQDLTDEECGRLIRAVIRYANGEDTEPLLQGAERIAFRFLKGNVDRNIQLSRTRAKAGSKGGSTSKPKQAETKGSKNPTKTKTEPKTKTETDTKTHTQPFLPDTEAAGIQSGHDRVLEAAQNAGFKSSLAERAGLLSLCAEYGPDRTVSGIGECVRHAAPTLAYLEAVLKGTGKKKPPSSDSPTYRQRDYSSEQEAAMDRMMAMEW